MPNFAAFKYEIQKQTNTKQNMGVNIPSLAAFKYEKQIQTNTKQNIDVINNSTKPCLLQIQITNKYKCKTIDGWQYKCMAVKKAKSTLIYKSFKAFKVLGFKVQNTLVILFNTGKTEQSYKLNISTNCSDMQLHLLKKVI